MNSTSDFYHQSRSTSNFYHRNRVTSDFYNRNGNFNYHQRSPRKPARRRDNYFQLNGRNNIPWEYGGGPNTWTRPQATKMPLAAANPPKPFTPRPPVNLIVTIPNFAGVSPPDLFIFRNPPAKSVKFPASTPAKVFPSSFSCPPANKDVEANLMKSDENDVQYLYTVETKGDEFVKVVDLSEDSQGCSNRLLSSNGIASSDVKMCGNDKMAPKMHEKETVPSSGAAGRTSRKRKKSSEDIHCDICVSGYQFIRNKGEEIFKSRCGHMFCQQCLKQLDPYKCPDCNIYLQKLFKVFL